MSKYTEKKPKPEPRAFHSLDDDEIHRLAGKGLITRGEASRLVREYGNGNVVMVAVDGELVWADVLSEEKAVQIYGREKIFGPSVK